MVSHLTYTYRIALFVFVCRRYRTPSALASLPHLPPPPPHPHLIMLTHSPSVLTPLALHPLLSFAVLSRCFVFYKSELHFRPPYSLLWSCSFNAASCILLLRIGSHADLLRLTDSFPLSYTKETDLTDHDEKSRHAPLNPIWPSPFCWHARINYLVPAGPRACSHA